MSLSMPLYVSVADVVNRMQINELTGVDDAITSAIIGAQIAIEKILGGQLTVQQQDCTYFLDSSAFSGMQPGGFFRLELPSGFLRQDQPFTVTFDDDWNLPNPQSMPSTDMKVDYDRGYLLISANKVSRLRGWYVAGYGGTTYRNKYVRVQCTTGFQASVPTPSFTTSALYNAGASYNPGDAVYKVVGGQVWVAAQASTGEDPATNPTYWTPVTYGPEQIPMDVYEAILSYVGTVWDTDQTTNRNQQAQATYEKAADHAIMMLRDYLRMTGFAFRPV